jgi:hypothetical protein
MRLQHLRNPLPHLNLLLVLNSKNNLEGLLVFDRYLPSEQDS